MSFEITNNTSLFGSFYTFTDHEKKSIIGVVAGSIIASLGYLLSQYPSLCAISVAPLAIGTSIVFLSSILLILSLNDKRIFQKLCREGDYETVLNFMIWPDFNPKIYGFDGNISIIKQIPENNYPFFYLHLGKFLPLLSQNEVLELANFLFEKELTALIKNLDHFLKAGLPKESLLDFANRIIKEKIDLVVKEGYSEENISICSINNERFSIFCDHVDHFLAAGLNEKELLRLTKIVLKGMDDDQLSDYVIKLLQIVRKQESIFEHAKILAQMRICWLADRSLGKHQILGFSEIIHAYIFELTKIIAENDLGSLSRYIDKFIVAGLTQQNVLDLIKILINKNKNNKDTNHFSYFIRCVLTLKFEQNVVREIANLLAVEKSIFLIEILACNIDGFAKAGLFEEEIFNYSAMIALQYPEIFALFFDEFLAAGFPEDKVIQHACNYIEVIGRENPASLVGHIDKFVKGGLSEEIICEYTYIYTNAIILLHPDFFIEHIEKFVKAGSLISEIYRHAYKYLETIAESKPEFFAKIIDKLVEAGLNRKEACKYIYKNAEFLAKNNPEFLVRNIDLFVKLGLSKQDVYKYAEMIAKIHPFALFLKFKKFIRVGLELKQPYDNFPDQDLAPFASFIKDINMDLFDAICATLPLFNQKISFLEKFALVYVIEKLPADERSNIVQEVLPLQAGLNYYWQLEFLRTASLLTKETRQSLYSQMSEVASHLNAHHPDSNPCQLLAEMLKQSSIREEIYASIRSRLLSLIEHHHHKTAHNYSEMLYRYADQIFLHDNHPLFHTIIEIFSICDPDVSTNPKNPFRIYQELRALAAKDSNFTPPIQKGIDGQAVAYQLENFTRTCKPKVYYHRDLPAGIDQKTLIDLFEDLEKRISLDDRIDKRIVEITESHFSDLRDNFLNDAKFMELLDYEKFHNHPIPFSTYKFFHILRILNAKNNVPSKGDLLSEQEEMLLQISNSIQLCPIGKIEGIAVFFKQIVTDQEEVLDEETLVLEYIENKIRTKIFNLISSDSLFMREVSGAKDEISQLAHHSIYIKNLLVGKVPLEDHHTVQLDISTRCLSNSLIPQIIPGESIGDRIKKYQQKRDDILTALHHHLPSPNHFIREFRESVNQKIMSEAEGGIEKGKIGFFNALVKFLHKHKSFLKSDQVWDAEEGCKLTESGAQEILCLTGLFSVQNNQEN